VLIPDITGTICRELSNSGNTVAKSRSPRWRTTVSPSIVRKFVVATGQGEDYLEAIAQVAEALDLQQPTLGGMAAQLVALQHPGVVVGNEHRV